jgi:hypothetical protein
MRRKRFQKDSVRPRKHGRQKVWVAQRWGRGQKKMQAFLEQKALTASRSTVDHLRWDLNSILKMALNDGIVPFNPAEIRQGSGVFDLRERLIFRLAIFEGLRPGEILALRLGNVFDDHVAVEQRVYKGTLDTPKGRKGAARQERSRCRLGLRMEIAVWRTTLLNCDIRSACKIWSAPIFSGIKENAIDSSRLAFDWIASVSHYFARRHTFYSFFGRSKL